MDNNILSESYTDKNTQAQAQESFNSQTPRNFIQLPNVLIPKQRAILLDNITKSTTWQTIKKPHYASYQFQEPSETMKSFFLNSNEMLSLISKITNTQIKAKQITWQIQKFTHKDFTILHDDHIQTNNANNENNQYLVILDLTRNWPFVARGEFIISSHNAQTPPLIIRPTENTLSIIKLNPNDLYFTKYVNASAKHKQITRIVGIIN